MNFEAFGELTATTFISAMLFVGLVFVVSILTLYLLKASRKEKMVKVLRAKAQHRRNVNENALLKTGSKKKKLSNRGDALPFDLVNPAAIKRDLRPWGFAPSLAFGVCFWGFVGFYHWAHDFECAFGKFSTFVSIYGNRPVHVFFCKKITDWCFH